jgi:hypothetical protein
MGDPATFVAAGPPATVTGFCESCGRNVALEPDGGELRQVPTGEFVCPACYALRADGAASRGGIASAATAIARSFRQLPTQRPILGPSLAIGAIVVGVGVAIVSQLGQAPSATVGDGAVLGIAHAGAPSPAGPSSVAIAPTAVASAAAASSAAPPTPAASSMSVGPAKTGSGVDVPVSVGPGSVITWQGLYGETRMQVIVPVRNAGPGWVALQRSSSTYRVLDATGREIGSGVFTAALPAAIGPAQTSYLVETVSAAFVVGRGVPSVEADVKAVGSDPPTVTLTVSDLNATTAADGGLRVTGKVRNDGTSSTGWVVAGAVVLDGTGRPIGAVYDPGRIGTIETGASVAFDTAYPGAPPIKGAGTTLVGVGFEALQGPAA